MKVIAATNRIDILDPALLRSGRLDRKIEFPLPNETARARILQIHSRKMSTSTDVNYDELARSTDEFNGAQLKAVCVEAGMIALREGATKLTHEHFLSGILEGERSSSALLNLILTLESVSSKQEEEQPYVFRLESFYTHLHGTSSVTSFHIILGDKLRVCHEIFISKLEMVLVRRVEYP